MIRAKQSALNQDTNHGLLLIRKSEIDYYTNLNIAFGTQAALIGGFTYGVFLTDHLNGNGSDILVVVQSIYWVLAAATMTLAVHVILTTMFIHVLGPGLALNGPIGSMVKAAEGMKVEQKPIGFCHLHANGFSFLCVHSYALLGCNELVFSLLLNNSVLTWGAILVVLL